MSVQLIQQYYAKVERLIQYGGSRNESTLRKAFQDLLEQYAHSKNLLLVPEVEYTTKRNHRVVPDGTLKDALRQDWGYWESKDEKDDLNAEIAAKFAKGYPSNNILFEDTHTAVLYQSGVEVMRADFAKPHEFDAILTLFVSYELPEVREFHKAIEQFSADVPGLAKVLREVIDEQYLINEAFKTSLDEFLELSRKAINPKVEMADVREMVIQHVLTEDIFMRVFDEADFHRDNVVAHKLQEVAGTFYRGATKRNIDARIAPYYDTINARAAQISDHHEKQKFLKALYENFYKAYNPFAADRLGVIYTPDEIVRFMIESTDHLLFKHFGKTLGDQYVEILDPATGTGTFITELIEYLPTHQLDLKYESEIHCNEVAILPYYIANLNIEYTYKQKMGKYKEFENICFVDTLDNLGFVRQDEHQLDFFGLWDENAERIKKQNLSKISVVIGNPPYNAWQENYNNQNANRQYPGIDKRIKETYIKSGKAQNQNAVYDMYTRFLRWASDRLSSNGVVAFVSNNSFISSRAFDGVRKVLSKEFNEIYIVDMKGNARTSGERRRQEGGNVFNDQIKVGIAIYFLVRKSENEGCKIYYYPIADYARSKEKQEFIRENRLSTIAFQSIKSDNNSNWIGNSDSDWNEFIPITREKNSIFRTYSNGVKTQRDEWVYSLSREALSEKMQYFSSIYNRAINSNIDAEKFTIKWDYDLERYRERHIPFTYKESKIIRSLYRPFFKQHLYFDKHVNGRVYQLDTMFPLPETNNIFLCISGLASSKPFQCLATDTIPCLDLLEKTLCFSFYYLNKFGIQQENVSDWALKRFQSKYKDKTISKADIFNYIYAVLHDPNYRQKYKLNLTRDLPRIPFYPNFAFWVKWGEALMDLHLNYEQAACYPLLREDKDPEQIRKAVAPILIARKDKGVIEIDTLTTLRGVPPEVWQYRLGTYTAVEWILERYKERAPKDPTIREKFNTYRFADYKEQVIDLILRVCTVSVETMKIIGQMPDDMPTT